MPIPKYNQMYKSFLSVLSDGKDHPLSDVKNKIIEDFHLTPEDCAETFSNGKYSVLSNRISWCSTYLKKAGLINSPTRGHLVITDVGKKLYETEAVITNNSLSQFTAFKEFVGKDSEHDSKNTTAEIKEETPQETMERVHAELNKVLSDEILTRIHQNSPDFFERLVVELLEKMGYGRGIVTQSTGDGGIDGIVYQDKLGFDVIYVQAKRYNPENTVGRPELHKFGGAIPEKNAKGLFVTTAHFSEGAKKYAEERHIILIDGRRLAQLMIEHDFGVSTEYVYKVKRIDTDLFEEDV